MSFTRDTSFAYQANQIIDTMVSTYSIPDDNILNYVRPWPLDFGAPAFVRGIADSDAGISIDADWNPHEENADKLAQTLDIAHGSKRMKVTDYVFAQDPQNVAVQTNDKMDAFMRGVERVLVDGATGNITIRGIADYPNATAGTINRPEMAGSVSTAGDWITGANMRADLIGADIALADAGFYGRRVLLLPLSMKSVLSEVITNTDTPVRKWVNSGLGFDTAYSPYVHYGATKDDFNAYLIDADHVYLGMSNVRVKNFYSDVGHAYYFDWETRFVPFFDPKYDGTEYLKGVVRLDARDYSD